MIVNLLRRTAAVFAERLDRGPIADVASMTRFTRTRAAYVAQTSLYGYLKTRMGTSFRRHFEDDEFSVVIRTSAVKLFVSCLGDLTVFAVATAGEEGRLSPDESAALARHGFAAGLDEAITERDADAVPADARAAFEARTAATHWPNAARGETAFAGSAADLLRYAPVVDEFKKLDEEIVTNSIRFRWRDVREQYRKRADGPAICADWRATAQGM